MITIDISEEMESHSDVADTLRRIADMIDKGYTSGYYPTWSLDGEEEQEETTIHKPKKQKK